MTKKEGISYSTDLINKTVILISLYHNYCLRTKYNIKIIYSNLKLLWEIKNMWKTTIQRKWAILSEKVYFRL